MHLKAFATMELSYGRATDPKMAARVLRMRLVKNGRITGVSKLSTERVWITLKIHFSTDVSAGPILKLGRIVPSPGEKDTTCDSGFFSYG